MSYSRRKFLKALRKHGAAIIRQGGEHTIVGFADGAQQPVPRHAQLNRFTVRGIVDGLGLDWKRVRKDL